MSVPLPAERLVLEELTAIFRQARGRREPAAGHAFFDALCDLERRAHEWNASASALRRIAESRFLAGLLRDAVTPVRSQALRGPRQFWTVPPDLRITRRSVLQG